ncbi:MAG: YifB family Mg chelatase-like AAA ATPase [Puniceicoccales bacterium]|jgi:magnesium chelatase family protein|nr:YifB family Mg chelatase-like AAA ATPase [Puniceicoccales bacterium]
MLAIIDSGSLHGIEAFPVHVEVNTGERGELRWVIVGLPDTAVKESQNRVFSALGNSGFRLPTSRTTINLAPGNLRKEGPFYDLPMALAIIAATQQSTLSLASQFLVAGELSLSGQTRPIAGAFNLALLAKKLHKRGLLLPKESALPATFVEGIEVYGVETLKQCVEFLSQRLSLSPLPHTLCANSNTADFIYDLSAVRGQKILKRAVEISVAGNHNLLMMGPPGCGKSMIAKCIPELMPNPAHKEWLEILQIQSACGFNNDPTLYKRPFRSPHHNISDAGLIGGGIIPQPGEISLAHGGVLFLDELPEFRRSVLEMLRQPLEEGKVTIVRTSGKLTFPCQTLLIAALNPCPCGYLGSRQRRCQCSSVQIQKYRARISGPLLDRMDLQLEVQPVDLSAFQTTLPMEEKSTDVKKRIAKARDMQLERAKTYNAYLSATQVDRFCYLNTQEQQWLHKACEQLQISARAYHKILKIARTIADLSGESCIQRQHLMEAMQYRCFDRTWQ